MRSLPIRAVVIVVLRITILALVVSPLGPSSAAEDPANVVEAVNVDVVAPAPLPGIGIPRDHVPSNVQSLTADIFNETGLGGSREAFQQAFTALARRCQLPTTLTLMGLGALPASDERFLGMLGMHGTVEANLAMHHADLIVCVGARFDDRITGRLDAFSPGSKKIHIDIDPSSINKNVKVDIGIVGDCREVLADMIAIWKETKPELNKVALNDWKRQIDLWRARKSFSYQNSDQIIKPQYAIERLYQLTKGREVFVTTEVGQHQMWAAQHFHFEEPNRWMTSGGLGTMGYGLPAAVGVQLAHPKALVIDIAGEASILMNMQEMSTAAQYRLPIKIFILNNEYMGMVRQWQELLHGGRYSESYSEALPDFVKLAEAYGHVGIKIEKPGDVEGALREAFRQKERLVFMDFITDQTENVFPMVPGGKGLTEMILAEEL